MKEINRIFYEFYKKHPVFVSTNVGLSLIIPVQDILLPHLYGKVISALEAKKNIVAPLVTVIIVIILVQIGFTLGDWHDTYLFPVMQAYLRREMVTKLFETFEFNNMDLNMGDIMSKIVKVPEHLSEWYERIKNYIFPYLITYLIAIIYFIYNDVYLGLGLFVLILVFIYFVIGAPWKCKEVSLEKDIYLNILHEEIDDTLRNITSVYGKGQNKEELDRIQEYEKEVKQSNLQVMKCAIRTRMVALIVLIAFLVLFIVRSNANLKSKKLSSATFVSLFIMLLYILNSMMVLIDQVRMMILDAGVISNFDDFFAFNQKPETTNFPNIHAEGIVINDISFIYPDTKPILEHLNLYIKKGEHVAIIGDIGSGKSTLLKILMKFQKPTSGMVYLDGVPYDQIPLRDLRRKIGYVPQQPILFNRTIMENIKYGNKNITDQYVYQLLNHLGLSKEFANLHVKVGKNGSKISGGQRQIVWCLRVLLSNPEVIILDEPTSSLDEKTKTAMKSLLDLFMKDRTVIMVTHDKSILSYADRNIVMKKND